MGWNTKGGGGAATSNVDAKARTDAAKALAKIGSIYKVGGDTLAAGDEVFVVMDSGNIINWKNPTAADITIPAKPTVANMKTAGLSQLSGNVAAQDIIQTWQTARSAWAATSQIDFTTSEPAMVAGNLNKIYWSTKTGKGSTSTALTFDNGDLYEIFRNDAGALEWREYAPNEGWTLTSGGKNYIYTSGAWTLQPTDKHEHPFLCDVTPRGSATVIYRVVTGSDKLWKNAKANPDTTVAFSDPKWFDNWVEAFPATAGVSFVTVADNAALKAKEYSVGEPPVNVVWHLTAPTATKDSYYTVINTGKGTIDVGGVQVIGEGSLEFTANAAGTTWVLTSREGAVASTPTINYHNSGAFDFNSIDTANAIYAGSSGVTTSNAPEGLAVPAAFYAFYEGDSQNGLAVAHIMGFPTGSRGVWYRLKTAGVWGTWTKESTQYFDFTPDPATQGQTYTVSTGQIAINDGDVLLLRDSAIKAAVRVVPVSTWDKVPAIDVTAAAKSAGWKITGTQPKSGNAVIDIFTDNFAKTWVIARAPDATSSVTDAVVLANLPADTWTDFPASTIVTAPNDYTILDAANNIDITDGLLTRRNGANWQLLSSVAMTNLTINLRG